MTRVLLTPQLVSPFISVYIYDGRKRRATGSRLGGSRQLVRKVMTSCDPNADGLSGSWRMYGQKYIDVDSRWPRSDSETYLYRSIGCGFSFLEGCLHVI